MKINIGNKTIDTDLLPDTEAEIWEALDNFNSVCTKYRVPAYSCFASNNNVISCFCIAEEPKERLMELEYLKTMFLDSYESNKGENE